MIKLDRPREQSGEKDAVAVVRMMISLLR